MRCKNCGNELREGVRFCNVCGQPVGTGSKRLCPECGASLDDDAYFCIACGAYVGEPKQESPLYTVVPLDHFVDPYDDIAIRGQENSKKTGEGRFDRRLVALAVFGIVACVLALCVLVVVGIAPIPTAQVESAENVTPSTSGDNSESSEEAVEEDNTGPDSLTDNTDVEKSSKALDIEEKGEVEVPAEAPMPDAPPVFNDIVASSTLAPDQVTSYYGPLNAIDGNAATAWNEGSSSDGSGEWIRLTSSSVQVVQGCSVIAGYPKSEDIYYKNNRPCDISVLLSDGYTLRTTLDDAMGSWQTVEFDHPHETTSLTITIESVYGGTQWNDCSFAEIEVF